MVNRWFPAGWVQQLRFISIGLRRCRKHQSDWRAWVAIGDFTIAVGTAVPTWVDGSWNAGEIVRHWNNLPRFHGKDADDDYA